MYYRARVIEIRWKKQSYPIGTYYWSKGNRHHFICLPRPQINRLLFGSYYRSGSKINKTLYGYTYLSMFVQRLLGYLLSCRKTRTSPILIPIRPFWCKFRPRRVYEYHEGTEWQLFKEKVLDYNGLDDVTPEYIKHHMYACQNGAGKRFIKT